MSYLASTSLLNDIAQLRAMINAPIIKRICLKLGNPFAAIKALITANGNEKIVCENFINLKIEYNFSSIFWLDLLIFFSLSENCILNVCFIDDKFAKS